MTAEKILFVDDEPRILQAYQRSLKKDFSIDVAVGGADGLIVLASQGPYAVIISDQQMPGINGLQFLAKAKEKSPDSVRVMLTGNSDQQTAIDAINQGSIFRFLTKPCTSSVLAKTITDALEQHRLIIAEKELLEKTLNGSVQILTEILSLINPTAFGGASRVRRVAKQIAGVLKIKNPWQVEIAAMLSHVGCITIPEETLAKAHDDHNLNPEEIQMLKLHPQVGYDLISHIPRLESVAEIIIHQEKLFNGDGPPHDNRRGKEIPIGARILKVALDFDKLAGSHIDHHAAVNELQSRLEWYDPDVLAALTTVLTNSIEYETKLVSIDELMPEMILAEDIVSVRGMLLISNGQELTRSLHLRLKNLFNGGAITEPIKVRIPVSTLADGNFENHDELNPTPT